MVEDPYIRVREDIIDHPVRKQRVANFDSVTPSNVASHGPVVIANNYQLTFEGL